MKAPRKITLLLFRSMEEEAAGRRSSFFLGLKGWMCAVGLGAILAGCTRFTQDPDPTPSTPISAVLPTFRLAWADGSQLTVNFDSLVHNKSQPYEVRFTKPTQGSLHITGNLLRYEPAQANWERDSCQYTLCQDGACGSGWIIFLNPNHTAACVQEVLIRRNVVSALDGFDLMVVPAGSSGRLVEWNADIYTVDTTELNNGKSLTYLAAGSGDSTSWGFDRITYRWEEGLTCHEGVIDITIGDTCAPHARSFTAATAGTAFFRQDTLARRGRGCHIQQVADGIFYLKGRQLRLATNYGVVTDTTIGPDSVRGLYYRRITPGVQSDGFEYYYIHNTDGSNRVTKAKVTLTF